MRNYDKALVIGGWSEDKRFLEGLRHAAENGPNRLANRVYAVTLAEALKYNVALNEAAADRIAILHSRAATVLKTAGTVVTLAGVESTPVLKTFNGGRKVAGNKLIGREEHVAKPSVTSGIVEVVRNPSTALIPFGLRRQSTIDHLVEVGEEGFPDGRYYIQYRNDEFGFARPENMVIAEAYDIPAAMLEGFHNQPLLHPKQAVEDINELMGR